MKENAVMRKGRRMLVLPLLVIPFLTLGFYAIGGGKRKGNLEKKTDNGGLNLSLPNASQREEKLMDKLGFYDQAKRDSAKKAEWMKSDPYYKKPATEPVTAELEQLTASAASKYNQRLKVSPNEAGQVKPEDQVLQRLSLLQKELKKNSTSADRGANDYGYPRSRPELSDDVEKLEALMNRMGHGHEEDPEIKQLSAVMDKILDVQHPARVKERLKDKATQEAAKVVAVSAHPPGDSIPKGFYGLEPGDAGKTSNAIEAVVNENQVLVNGAVIKLRLLQDVYAGGQQIPAGTFLFGVAGLNGERLEVEIQSIRSGNSLFPVKLEVYAMDGLPGIHIPGAITRDVAKQSADNSLQMMELASMDPSLKAQAATAGINTAKALFSRKVKGVRVTVKAGYKVMLKDKDIQR